MTNNCSSDVEISFNLRFNSTSPTVVPSDFNVSSRKEMGCFFGGGKEDRAKKRGVRKQGVQHSRGATEHDPPRSTTPATIVWSDAHLHLQVWPPLRLPIDRRQLNVHLDMWVEEEIKGDVSGV